MLKGIT